MSENKDSETRIALLVVSTLIAAVVIGVVWFGAAQGSKGKSLATDTPVSTQPVVLVPIEPEPAPVIITTTTEEVTVVTPVIASPDESYVVVEDAVVKFYFATGKADIPANAADALLDIVAAANSGKKIVISGFTDASGNVALNEELAKQRAFAVRDALTGLNVPEETLELRKPENMTGTGNAAEARRVEVRVTE